MIPLLIPQSQRQNVVLQQTLPQLSSHFQVREIQDSPSTPGDVVFPSLGIACLIILNSEKLDEMVVCAANILQRRRRCLILVPPQEVSDVQLRYLNPNDALTIG
jgi:hypothetical protein